MVPSPRLLMAARILANLTAEQLAAASRVGIATIRRLERGESHGQARTLEALAAALVAAGIEFHLAPDGSREGISRKRVPEGKGAMSPPRRSDLTTGG
jgi:transcriptional regulator with XRE-family HTH domain